MNEFKGICIHPDLVHFVAEWCSVKYAFYVKDIMDSIDKKVHEKLDEEELEDTVENAKHFDEVQIFTSSKCDAKQAFYELTKAL
ncbi:hypothetical protein TVAG_007350 [Trichomonas vaginalis G3]|uniref:KilA-N domain-containing protein n=1 Tax=Trichomonas vaginalis (strain ATCC PRA-98 / G3) TaxID=412133 RepID=A2FPZ3_TRIV3|nr:KilA, N-terminal/APSES-type HTH, DNA-binding family [Trichomonas vaginalis G3]EAX93011.1 hypothetical protein TVAG_007350 [Trichomonas vaginalis G3]KAI5539592.1 KilA, N-terminal/APSES-type HTH, DNA-binding family [Trichomonas vaginalis G3]|eukprot:XP_001305941.1 hypothetical protein [Trichomonas vaginalis G3]